MCNISNCAQGLCDIPSKTNSGQRLSREENWVWRKQNGLLENKVNTVNFYSSIYEIRANKWKVCGKQSITIKLFHCGNNLNKGNAIWETRLTGVVLYQMLESSSKLQLTFCGTLKGHKGWVTSIDVPSDPTKNYIVSGSRGTIINPLNSALLNGWMDGYGMDAWVLIKPMSMSFHT